jgi:iron complex outermembrane receptor protein
MKKFQLNGTSLAISAFVAAVSSTSVNTMAQGYTLEEVVVTARKREESLQDVPSSVSSYSPDQLDAMNLTDTSQLGKFSPGVNIGPAPASHGTATKVSIRGQVQTDDLITLDPSVGWYTDDVYIARTYGTVNSLFDLDRVEILKGPQGTLYGRNTTGGAMKLVTTKADPSNGVSGFVSGGVGNYEKRKLGGAINIPLIEDKLAIRLAANKDENKEGYGDVTIYDYNALAQPVPTLTAGSTEDWGTKDNEMYRANVTWNVTDQFVAYFSYEHTESEVISMNYNMSTTAPFGGDVPVGTIASGFLPLAPSGGDYYDGTLNALPRSTSETDTFSTTLQYDINDSLQTKLILGWREVDADFVSDVDGSGVPLNSFASPFTSNAKQKSVEWQLSGSAFNNGVEWLAGFYWFEEEGSDYSESIGGYNPIQIYDVIDASAENESQSAFVSATWAITDAININAGLRYTEDTKSVESGVVAVNELTLTETCLLDSNFGLPNLDVNTCRWNTSEDYSYVSYDLGVDYTFSDGTMVYLKTAKASRSGGQNLRAADAESAQPFDPEVATSYELGLKSQWLDNRLQFNAAMYYVDNEDIQASFFDSVGGLSITRVVNSGDAEITGIEIEGKWVISDNWMLTGGYNKLDWQFKDSDAVIPLAPDEEVALRLNYMLSTGIGTFDFDVNYSYRGEMFSNTQLTKAEAEAAGNIEIDSVNLVGARVSWAPEGIDMTISLWGDNLTDEEYRTSSLNLNPSAPINNSTLGTPRTYGLDVKYKF